MQSLAKRNYLSELRGLDWDFHAQSGQDGLAAYHWYPARYLPQVPGVLIGYLSAPGERVLDPFCGSGTTLVEARRLRRAADGIDTNPVAAMTTLAKIIDFDASKWTRYLEELRNQVHQNMLTSSQAEDWVESVVPMIVEQRGWYHAQTLNELASVWMAIRASEGPYQTVADVAFSGMLRFVCSQDRHWGWICDNVKPKALSYRPAIKTFFDRMAAYPSLLQESVGNPSVSVPPVNMHTGKCADVLAEMPAESFDLVVTSPPYFSMTDYMRSQRLTFLWHGWKLDTLKTQESGARYKRHRQSALEQYMAEMRSSFAEVLRVLRPGRSCCIVIGESPKREPYLDAFRDEIVSLGLKIEARIQRRVATQRTFAGLKHEEIVVAKKR